MHIRIFISSVQREFAEERRLLVEYIRQDVCLTPAKLSSKHSSELTNPILAHPVYLAGYIERLGTGTNDLIDACTSMGLKKPTFVQEEDFCITIWRNVDGVALKGSESLSENLEKTTTETTTEILRLLIENPYMTNQELADKCGLSKDGIYYNIKILKQKGILERVGSNKGGYWKVNVKQ